MERAMTCKVAVVVVVVKKLFDVHKMATKIHKARGKSPENLWQPTKNPKCEEVCGKVWYIT